MFWNVLYKLCEENSTKPYVVAKAIGASNAVCTKWKNGSIPNGETLLKLANYFNVSVDFLLGRTDTPTGYSSGVSNVQMNVNSPQGSNTIRTEPISAEDAELLELIKKLPLKKRVKFISSLYDELEEE